MKPAVLAGQLRPLLPSLCCPRCRNPFSLTEQSLICSDGHCFDLSRRGYINLAPSHDQSGEKYDAALFESRSCVLEAGFYAPVADAAIRCLEQAFPEGAFTLLDVGCGEGYYARQLAGHFPSAHVLGLDISRDAITAAARQSHNAVWLVADLKHLPIADGCADAVLDVLTPADYAEFRRVLSPEGLLIKVIPGDDYLREIREAVAPFLRGGADYSGQRVLEHLFQHAQILSQQEIRHTLPLTPELSRAFLRMTPMTFSVPEDALQTISLSQITIHMQLLCCRMMG